MSSSTTAAENFKAVLLHTATHERWVELALEPLWFLHTGKRTKKLDEPLERLFWGRVRRIQSHIGEMGFTPRDLNLVAYENQGAALTLAVLDEPCTRTRWERIAHCFTYATELVSSLQRLNASDRKTIQLLDYSLSTIEFIEKERGEIALDILLACEISCAEAVLWWTVDAPRAKHLFLERFVAMVERDRRIIARSMAEAFWVRIMQNRVMELLEHPDAFEVDRGDQLARTMGFFLCNSVEMLRGAGCTCTALMDKLKVLGCVLLNADRVFRLTRCHIEFGVDAGVVKRQIHAVMAEQPLKIWKESFVEYAD